MYVVALYVRNVLIRYSFIFMTIIPALACAMMASFPNNCSSPAVDTGDAMDVEAESFPVAETIVAGNHYVEVALNESPPSVRTRNESPP